MSAVKTAHPTYPLGNIGHLDIHLENVEAKTIRIPVSLCNSVLRVKTVDLTGFSPVILSNEFS